MNQHAVEVVSPLTEEYLLSLTPDKITDLSKSQAKDIISKYYTQDGIKTTPVTKEMEYQIDLQTIILENAYILAQLSLQPPPLITSQNVVERTTCATFGNGPESITLLGIIRVSPGGEFSADGYSNDGSSQFLQILSCGKLYADVHNVTVNVERVFISIGVDRRLAEESFALAELTRFLGRIDHDNVLVVAVDSMRLGLYTSTVQKTEVLIRGRCKNAKVRFIGSWGLVNKDDSGQELHTALSKAVEKREKELSDVSDKYSKNNAGKSVDVDTADGVKDQIRTKEKRKEIRESMDTNNAIKNAGNLGILLLDHLGYNQKLPIDHPSNKASTLEMIRQKWVEVVYRSSGRIRQANPNKIGRDRVLEWSNNECDEEQAANEFLQFYNKNKRELGIDAFIQQYLPNANAQDIVANYARTSTKGMNPDHQIAVNCACEFILHDGNMPDITICDLAKRRERIGSPAFVVLLILACSGFVKRGVMANPVRASSEIDELDVMKELEKLFAPGLDFFSFSECIGKPHKDLFEAEHKRKEEIAVIMVRFKNEILKLEKKLLLSTDERMLYDNMKLIYQTIPSVYLEDAAYEEEWDEDEESDEEWDEESDEEWDEENDADSYEESDGDSVNQP